MAAKRVLIITNERVANPGGVPEAIVKQVREADAVCVVAPTLTSRLHSSRVSAPSRRIRSRRWPTPWWSSGPMP